MLSDNGMARCLSTRDWVYRSDFYENEVLYEKKVDLLENLKN